MKSIYTIIALFCSGYHGHAEERTDFDIWVDDPKVFQCQPESLYVGYALEVKLAKDHPKEFGVESHDKNEWYALVMADPPKGAKLLMSTQEFAQTTHLVLPPGTNGATFAESAINRVLFSKPGRYTLYLSNVLESDIGGYKCSVNVLGPSN